MRGVRRVLAIPTHAVLAGVLSPMSHSVDKIVNRDYFEICRQHDTDQPLSRVSTGYTYCISQASFKLKASGHIRYLVCDNNRLTNVVNMVDKQSVRTLSPKGTDTLLWDDIESKRHTSYSSNCTTTTFDIFTRRFTTFTSTATTNYENKFPCINEDDAIRQIKLKIIKYNPMIFYMLRDYLVARRCYTTATVSSTLHQFVNVELRIPELRSEIINHQLSYTHNQSFKNNSTTTSSMFFAYLTGESLSPSSTIISPNKRTTPTSLTRSVTSSSSYSDSSTSQDSQELSLPSLQSFGQNARGCPNDVVHC